MKIILMYDLPMNSTIENKQYTIFHKKIIKRGYIMLQYSLYYKTINSVTKYGYEQTFLNKSMPLKGNIRCMLITERQFYNMKLLKGSKLINEEINNGKRYLKIDENLWEKY